MLRVLKRSCLLLAAVASGESASGTAGLDERLFDLAAAGEIEELKELIAQGADANAANDFGERPLHLAAIAEGQGAAVVDTLLAARADPSAATRGEYEGHAVPVRRTSLMWFIGFRMCDVQAVQSLLTARADVNYRSEEGKTALDYANERSSDCDEAKEALVKAGALTGGQLEERKSGDL